MPRPLPSPLKLCARLVVASVAVLVVAHHFESTLVERVIPLFRATLAAVSNDFTIRTMDVAHEGPSATLHVRADFAHPVFVGRQFVYPLQEHGWLEINFTLGGVLQYSLFLLILVVAWPASNAFEFICRLALSIPPIFFLLMLNAASTILAELWFPFHQDLDPQTVWPLLVWSKFLMGGGGLAIALLLAACNIFFAARLARRIQIDRMPTVSTSNAGT